MNKNKNCMSQEKVDRIEIVLYWLSIKEWKLFSNHNLICAHVIAT